MSAKSDRLSVAGVPAAPWRTRIAPADAPARKARTGEPPARRATRPWRLRPLALAGLAALCVIALVAYGVTEVPEYFTTMTAALMAP